MSVTTSRSSLQDRCGLFKYSYNRPAVFTRALYLVFFTSSVISL